MAVPFGTGEVFMFESKDEGECEKSGRKRRIVEDTQIFIDGGEMKGDDRVALAVCAPGSYILVYSSSSETTTMLSSLSTFCPSCY